MNGSPSPTMPWPPTGRQTIVSSASALVVRLSDVALATDVDPDYPDATEGEGAGARNFHLVRRHFDIRAFGVNGVTGNAGDEMVEPYDERDDEAQLTNGHEELFAVMSGHAVFTVDGEDLDAAQARSCSCATRRSSAAPRDRRRRSSRSAAPPGGRSRSPAGSAHGSRELAGVRRPRHQALSADRADRRMRAS